MIIYDVLIQIKTSFPAEGDRLERLNTVDTGLSSRMARKRRLITSMMHPAITVGPRRNITS